MNTRRIILLGICLGISTFSYSQDQKDSISQKVVQYAMEKFPSIRTLNIEYDHQAPFKYSSKENVNKLPENKVGGVNRVVIDGNKTVLVKNGWIFGTKINYSYNSFTLADPNPVSGVQTEILQDYHYFAAGLNVARVSKLFGKPFIYSGSLIVDGSDKHFERLRGILTGTLVLKTDERTKMTVGLAAMVDPTVLIPVLPSFSYEYKFRNGWILDVILPQKVYMRKELLKNGRISFGSEMAGSTFYLYDLYGKKQRYQYQQLEINSGLMYEHNLGRSFVGTLKSGLRSIPTGRIFEKSGSFNDYIYEARPQSSFYINVGVSFNPFEMKRK
jgi:hypothetical protein